MHKLICVIERSNNHWVLEFPSVNRKPLALKANDCNPYFYVNSLKGKEMEERMEMFVRVYLQNYLK